MEPKMKHIFQLNENAHKLLQYADEVERAETTAELDKAKLAGLQIYQETLREANRAFMEFNALAKSARARVVQANYEETRRAARPEPVEDTWTTNEVYLEPVESPKPKKAKATKKTRVKKAKK